MTETIAAPSGAVSGGGAAAAMVEAVGLTKRYGAFEAVRGIGFRVDAGEAVGFLGPNGAGKSSTMRMLATVSAPSAGVLRVVGLDPVARRADRAGSARCRPPGRHPRR